MAKVFNHLFECWGFSRGREDATRLHLSLTDSRSLILILERRRRRWWWWYNNNKKMPVEHIVRWSWRELVALVAAGNLILLHTPVCVWREFRPAWIIIKNSLCTVQHQGFKMNARLLALWPNAINNCSCNVIRFTVIPLKSGRQLRINKIAMHHRYKEYSYRTYWKMSDKMNFV